ncbi:MAG: aminotransferase class III-fold pyridoxal phosphate-dependent enzyme, partial [Solirubrobacterales bacterium]|nr:aminotransferase class III-fold pyridoxal phosphate-dependent enzyme [Solirubrobacterales bacterium]
MKAPPTYRRLLSTSLTSGAEAVPNVIGGEGVWFELEDGRRVIDASNTAAPLGHAHPEVVQAIHAAAAAPVVNEGLGWQGREAAAQELIATTLADEDWVGAVRFFISASEANDAALSLAQALTGRGDLATRERAYHGGAGLARELTVQPQWHGGLSGASGAIAVPPRLAEVHTLPAPSGARVTGQPDPTAGDEWLEGAEAVFARSAAVILDYSQGGIYHSPTYQDRVAALARRTGTLWIADETVTGFGRVGNWYQFLHGESRPDMITMGKCLAAGGAAAGAIVLSRTMVDHLAEQRWQTYSTFRGHPVQVAAISAHVRVSLREGLYQRALELDQVMLAELKRVAA